MSVSLRAWAAGDGSLAWLGASEMATRVLAHDWSHSPLGPLDGWPQSLRSAVSICLRSRFPMAIYWGPELACIYNDAEREVLGRLHPAALGLPARELLVDDSWEVIGSQLEAVLRTGEANWVEDQPLALDRTGTPGIAHFTCSYSAIPDDRSRIGGVLLVAHETTARVRAIVERSVIRSRQAEAHGRATERALRERELHDLLRDLRAAQRRAVAAGDAERQRIETNLHDGAQQRLMAVRLELGLLGESLEQDPGAARAELARLGGELDDALEELRELAHGLYPPLLATDGLPAAVTAVARRATTPVQVDIADFERPPRAIENAAYFCCLEALQNVAKHAGAGARATVSLEVRDRELRFQVTDDGVGFDRATAFGGHGLTNLDDRLQALGGRAEIASAPGRGTTVTGWMPVTVPDDQPSR